MNLNYQQQLNQAVTLLQRQQYSQADLIISNLLKASPRDFQLWHLKSIVLNVQSKFEECLIAIKRALKFNPNFVPALQNLAKLNTTLNKLDEAISTYEKLIKINHQDFQSSLNLSILYNRKDKYSLSYPILKNLHNKFPDNINIKIAFGQSLMHLNQLDDAAAIYNQALILDSNNISVLNNLGITYKKMCKWEDAKEVLQKALKIDDKQTEVLKNLASIYTLTGEVELSKSYYQKAITQNPADEDSHHWLNKMLWEQNDPNFLESYHHSLQKHPNNTNLMYELAHQQLQADKIEGALSTLNMLLETDPKHIKALVNKSIIEKELSRFEQAYETIKFAHGIQPENFTVNEELAKSYLALNQPDDAIKVLDSILAVQPDQQGWLAFKTTALKLKGSAEYDYYCDYDKLLFSAEINLPSGYNSLNQFNEELTNALIEVHHNKQHPLDQSLKFGSQTGEKLFDYHVPIIQQLRKSLREQTLSYLSSLPKDSRHPTYRRNTGDYIETDSWSVILNSKGFHKNHFHPAGWISGPYYVKLPQEMEDTDKKQGWIKFGQPGFNMQTPLKPDVTIQPKEGHIVQFPSYFWHGTIPILSTKKRITVPYDIIPL